MTDIRPSVCHTQSIFFISVIITAAIEMLLINDKIRYAKFGTINKYLTVQNIAQHPRNILFFEKEGTREEEIQSIEDSFSQ